MAILEKTLTGISGEFYAAAELSRRNYAVSITFGNTKAIDLLAEKDGNTYMFQVKSIQSRKSISFNMAIKSVKKACHYILVNLNADTLEAPEFFILTSDEMKESLNFAQSGRDWVNYNFLKRSGQFYNAWSKIKPLEAELLQ